MGSYRARGGDCPDSEAGHWGSIALRLRSSLNTQFNSTAKIVFVSNFNQELDTPLKPPP
ncbi:hypothetical protein [Cohnella silvisoli]|uniref:Uncharacterized protein n=1 Tax=Cohnella silvisoli TaxID=2873699 RepID=A0ABV1L0K7_9BACL|nr:hypothetical protein [Cohnella silvisoli]MCD9025162.1 hypothetical protein [Cohnella silvisoli]